MTRATAPDAPTGAAPPPFVLTGRPVARFVAVLGVLALLLAALWWSGLVAPRLSISVSNRFDPQTNTGVALVVVRNDGPLAARMRTLRIGERPQRQYFEPPVRLVGRIPAGAVRVEGGGSAGYTVTYAVACDGADRARNSERGYVTPGLRLRLQVEGPVGVERSVNQDEVVLGGACGEPVEP